MKDLYMRELRKVPMIDGTRTTYQYFRKNGQIDVPEVKKIVDRLERKAVEKGEDIKIAVRGLNVEKWNTLKGYDSELNIQDFADYYRNRVEDPSKFEMFNQLQITIMKVE
jgi:hypothetical protein